MIGLLGKKIGMTSIFDQQGRQVPVTVLEVGPCTVLSLKQKEKDGYQAVQLGFDAQTEKRINKPEAGFFKKLNVKPVKFIKEIRTKSLEGLEVGKQMHVNNFAVNDLVDVIGTSIGRGFQGVVRRHGFKGGGRSHGSMFGRVAGSIGQASNPKRVFKGLRMPGHMGDEQVTIQNLKVVKIDAENNLMVIRGAVPGYKNQYVIVREAVKKQRPRKWRTPEEGVEELKVEEKVKAVTKKKEGAKPAAKKPEPAAKKK